MRVCCGPRRGFNINIMDNNNQVFYFSYLLVSYFLIHKRYFILSQFYTLDEILSVLQDAVGLQNV
jgi:hypothetical protein